MEHEQLKVCGSERRSNLYESLGHRLHIYLYRHSSANDHQQQLTPFIIQYQGILCLLFHERHTPLFN